MAKNKAELLQVDGLENTQQVEVVTTETTTNQPNFSNREWLENNDPLPYQYGEFISSKYDAEREPKILEGLEILSKVKIGETNTNPLLILLGKWFEVKPARAEVKRMIDAEAKEKDVEPSTYLQDILSQEIDNLICIQTAIDRLRYAKTYFKPRVKVEKIELKTISVDGEMYQVPTNLLVELKEKFGTDNESIKQHIIENCEKFEIESF